MLFCGCLSFRILHCNLDRAIWNFIKRYIGGGGSISILRRYKFLFIYKYNWSKILNFKGKGGGADHRSMKKKSPPHDSAFYHIILCVCCKYDWTTNVIFQNKGSLSSDKRDTPKLMLICMHMDVTVVASFESHLVKTVVIYINSRVTIHIKRDPSLKGDSIWKKSETQLEN